MQNLIKQQIIKIKRKYLTINLIAYTEVIIGIILTLKYFNNNSMLTIANVLLVTSVILELWSLRIQHSRTYRKLLIQVKSSRTRIKTIIIDWRSKNRVRILIRYLIFFFSMIFISYLFFHFFIRSIWTILLFLMVLNTVIDLKHLINVKNEVE